MGVICGAKERIDEIIRFKSNMDSGMFLPVQLAAAKALSQGSDWFAEINEVYRQRRFKAYQLLDLLQCNYSKDQAGLFVWAKIPVQYKDGFAVSDDILYNAKVFITPGGIFGTAGDMYIRLSLCSTEERFETSIKRIQKIVAK